MPAPTQAPCKNAVVRAARRVHQARRRTQRANRVRPHQIGRLAKFRKITPGAEVGAIGTQLHGGQRGIIASERQMLDEFIAHARIDRIAARWMGESDRQYLALSRAAHSSAGRLASPAAHA